MRNRMLRLAILAAVSLGIPAATSSAQETRLPPPLASAPAYAVPDQLLARRAELALTKAQAAGLAALSAELHADDQLVAESSKPWVTAPRRPSPQAALDRALAMLTPTQRAQAVQLLASTDEEAAG